MSACLRLIDPPRRNVACLDDHDWREYDRERAEYHALAELRTPAGAADAVRIWQEDGKSDWQLAVMLLHRLLLADAGREQSRQEMLSAVDKLCEQIARHYVEYRTPEIIATFGRGDRQP